MSLLNLMNLFISVCEIVKSGENVKSGDYCAKGRRQKKLVFLDFKLSVSQ